MLAVVCPHELEHTSKHLVYVGRLQKLKLISQKGLVDDWKSHLELHKSWNQAHYGGE